MQSQNYEVRWQVVRTTVPGKHPQLRGREDLHGVGKRRIGKSELIRQFCRDKRSITFTLGNLSDQLEYMTDVLDEFGGESREAPDSLYRCLRWTADICKESPTIVVFDEFLVAGKRGRSKTRLHPRSRGS